MKNRVSKFRYKSLIIIAICFFAMCFMLTNNRVVAVATETVGIGESSATKEAEKSEGDDEENSKDKSSVELAIVEVANYELDEGILAAGNDISIILTLHNLSSKYTAESVMLTVSSDSGMIYPSYGNDNQFYVGDIPTDGTVEVKVPMTVSSSFTQDYVDLKCQFNYVSKKSRVTNSSTMIITTSGGNRIFVKSIDVSTNAIVNGKSLISINFSNKGNSNIDDAKLIIEGNVSEESKEIDLGTVNAGKNYSKDLNVTFSEIGDQSINIILNYTDGQGELIETSLGRYTVSVSEQVLLENQEDEDFNVILVWGGRFIALVFSLIALYVIALYIKKR